jgi:uncharacterized Zn-finger protein
MARENTPAYKNDIGVPVIKIGARGFVCIGCTPPNDHPHIYLTMNSSDYKLCLYCNTRYEYDPTLSPQYTQPPECYHGESHINND